jgi:hypothetical protein
LTTWTAEELTSVSETEELRLAPRRGDGTLQKPRILWVVRLAGDLYVRSVNGQSADWIRAAQRTHVGHIRAGGIDSEVTFEDADSGLDDQVDSAYREKYGRYPESLVASVLIEQAKAPTLRLVPHPS